MKTVIIITSEAAEGAAIAFLFEGWQTELNLLMAEETKAAIATMMQHPVDLMICDLAMLDAKILKGFSLLTHTFPYIPCIALCTQSGIEPAEALKRGASHCLVRPIIATEFQQHAANLLDADTYGTVTGIPVHNFLQILESEGKTCTLQVDHQNDTGQLYIQNGQLINAETRYLTGEKAIRRILAWRETNVQIRHFNGQRKRLLDKQFLLPIMEKFRLTTEKEKVNQEVPDSKEQQASLKHLPTLGRRIPLEIGSSVKIEFPQLDTPLESSMVGMLPDQYLILTNPQPFAEFDENIDLEQRIIIKYVLKGRVWMFKVQLLKTLEKPFQLFFFEYPAVIHYHELRQAKRSAIFIPCTFHMPEVSEIYGTLVNMSMTGALCQIKHKTHLPLPRIDTTRPIMLRCLLPGIKEEQIFNGAIRNLAIDATETRIGIEFKDLQPHLAETIGKYLFAMEEEGEV